ncbi:MAG: peptidylprolyl isomerase [Comamonadaceae bacterium]|nr:peptidylprolyl isomerase [Comamonadaceae bacterium]
MSSAAAVAQQLAGATVVVKGSLDQVVTVDDVRSELQRMTEQSRTSVLAKPDALQQVASNLLIRRVLAVEAKRDGLAQQPLTAAALQVAADKALSDARMAALDDQNAPSEAALDAYARGAYQASKERFEKPAQTRARHILIDNKGPESLQKAKDLLAQLRGGASFDDLAKAHSKDPGSAARGGDLGFFGAGQMVRPFEDAVNTLKKPGDLSEPVESQFGLHIIRLEERREKSRQAYEEVRQVLMAEARSALVNEARMQKLQMISKDFTFDAAALESLRKPAAK